MVYINEAISDDDERALFLEYMIKDLLVMILNSNILINILFTKWFYFITNVLLRFSVSYSLIYKMKVE